jgi:hypothetical protein
MKILKKTLTVLAISLAFCLDVQAATFGNFTYEDTGSSITITFYPRSATGSVVIPSTIDGKPVASIGHRAFDGCYGLASVTIPSSVTTIEQSAFEDCTGLTSVTIPSSVTSIGALAFFNCRGLTSITIPSSVTSIGEAAFNYCSGLTSVTIPTSVTTIEQSTFSKCTGLTSVTIPSSVTSIGDSAFSYCTGLTSVTIPSSVTSIGDFAFGRCSGLTSVTIPSGVISIRDFAFNECTGLTSVTIPSGVTSIGYGAFRGCTGLASIMIPSSVTTIEQSTFSECTGLTSVTIPSSVTSIGDEAFSYCRNLNAAIFEGNAPTLGSSVFDYVTDIFKIYYYNGKTGFTSPTWYGYTTEIITATFGNFTYTVDGTSITIRGFVSSPTGALNIPAMIDGKPVTSIGDSTFSGCAGLTSVTIPSSVTSIGEYAFSGCLNISEAIFEGNAPTLGSDVFNEVAGTFKIYYYNGKTGFSTPTWYGYPTSIVPFTFGNFTYTVDGTSITIRGYVIPPTGALNIPATIDGKPLTSIGNSAFSGCTGLTSVTIPSSVTSIGEYAFSGCLNISEAIFEGNAPSLGSNVFNNVAGTFKIYYYNGKTGFSTPTWYGYPTAIVLATFGNFTYTVDGTSITIRGYVISPTGALNIPATIDGKPVTSIVDSAFRNCTGLTSVTIPSSVTSIGNSTFSGCTGLTSVTIPSSVTSIGNSTFSGCTGLTSVTIPSSVTSIGNSAFSRCSGLTSVTIPSGVTSIGHFAFHSCTGLSTVTITSGVTSIGDDAFYKCTGLTSVTIPSSVTSIGGEAFFGCLNLSEAIFEGNAPTLGSSVFDEVRGTFKIYYSDGKTGFSTPIWYGYSTAVIIDRPEISIEQIAGKSLVDGSANISFGSVIIGKKGKLKTFTIKNIGNQTLKGFPIKVNGKHAKDFIVTKVKKSSLASGASTTFKIEFKPSAKGTRKAEIQIKSNDADENPFNMKLNGRGKK